MLSDESSSDSETGRFKGRSEKQDQLSKTTNQRDKGLRSTGRDRHTESNRFHRAVDRKWDEKERFDRLPRERHRYSRNSPVRRRRSNERSPNRKRSRERHRRGSNDRSRTKDGRSDSRDGTHSSRSKSYKPVEQKRDFKEEIKRNLAPRDQKTSPSSTKPKSSDKFDRVSRDKQSSSPEVKGKRSEIYKPSSMDKKKKSESPVAVEERDNDSNISEEVQPGSYYSMMPTVVKEKSEDSSEIDSSDDEKLRAKLLNLEKELHQAKKKKHKKKHRKKEKPVGDEKDIETLTSVEVSSTTDILEKVKTDPSGNHLDTTEVTSTQKNNQIESNEEGEIVSDDDSQPGPNIDQTDLRHKLKRSVVKAETVESIDLRAKMKSRSDVCGPALPPHLENQLSKSRMPDTEGPALPPQMRKSNRTIGPSIPEQLRNELAQGVCEVIKCESSDDADDGIGPLPAGAEGKWSEAHRQLEERALDMKIRSLDGHSMHRSKVKSREQWMLELPEGKAKYLGLEARSFRAKEAPDMSNRSSWTDTPEEKARKEAGLDEEDLDASLQRDARARQLASRDEDQEKAAKKHKKKHKREESLLELHEKKLKKKKKKSEKDEKSERRPFSRDVDLQVNRFDEAQKRSVIKKAQELDNRFSRGEAKYL